MEDVITREVLEKFYDEFLSLNELLARIAENLEKIEEAIDRVE